MAVSRSDVLEWHVEGAKTLKRQIANANGRRAAAPPGTPLVHLQGVGKTPAKRGGDLKTGDTLVWNGGATSKVVGVKPHSSRYVMVTTESEGKQYTRKMGRDRLVAYDPR